MIPTRRFNDWLQIGSQTTTLGLPIWSQVLVSQNVPYIKTLWIFAAFFPSSDGEEAVSHALCFSAGWCGFWTEMHSEHVFSKLNQLHLKLNRNKLSRMGWNQGTFGLSTFTKKSDLNVAGKQNKHIDSSWGDNISGHATRSTWARRLLRQYIYI